MMAYVWTKVVREITGQQVAGSSSGGQSFFIPSALVQQHHHKPRYYFFSTPPCLKIAVEDGMTKDESKKRKKKNLKIYYYKNSRRQEISILKHLNILTLLRKKTNMFRSEQVAQYIHIQLFKKKKTNKNKHIIYMYVATYLNFIKNIKNLLKLFIFTRLSL